MHTSETTGARRATAHDLDDVTAIERSAFTDPWSRDSFAALLSNNRVLFRIVNGPKGEVLGYVVAWFVADECEIANLAVAPKARGHGLGGMLLDCAIAAARTQHVASVYLEVRASNSLARRLYEKRGFEVVSQRYKYYHRPLEDALVLRLAIDYPNDPKPPGT